MPRRSPARGILLGNLGPIMRMGMRRVLTEHGCDVVEEEDRPSGIVCGGPSPASRRRGLDLGRRVGRRVGPTGFAGASPETTVVLWAREEELMEVVDPGFSDSRRVFAPVLEDYKAS